MRGNWLSDDEFSSDNPPPSFDPMEVPRVRRRSAVFADEGIEPEPVEQSTAAPVATPQWAQFLILAGAVNTSLIGVNGVLNRVAEDGVLIDWFRRPHSKFGTTYRILNTMAILQILTILASRGDVLLLGEAYAFGVVWSFALKALGVLVLRYQRHDQEYKVPLNFTFRGREIPVGLAVATAVLFLVAIALITMLFGMVLEGLPAAVVLIPVVFPIAEKMGINPIHFNIVVTASVGIGLFLPPMGVGLLMALRFANLSVGQHWRAYMPYIGALVVGLMLIILFPEISLTLPRFAGAIR